ncbi:flagella synthesis protein FlgN [Methylovorus mays]|uniref:flagella synthesis protein FlgN n=1 Tax=Methylovorus mays TaxID=184077 RepID=UPI001E3CFF02|nr:flagellar protein FlgN [Methylovorus mays]MCB5207477.1 flagellar protein FlgN [Methylovorus mays]
MSARISFEQDTQLVNQLIVLLSREQASLVKADMDEIEPILAEKAQLLNQLGAVVQNRYKALAVHGFEGSEKGMADWLVAQKTAEIQQAWMKFNKMLLQAKEMNRVNGVLINKHFSRNQQFLSALQNQHSAGQIYGSNGRATTQNYLRSGLQV